MAVQGHQIVIESAPSNLGLPSKSALDQIISSINQRLVRPLDIKANGSTTVSITGSGPFLQADESQILMAPVNNTVLSYAGESLDIATGTFSGGSSVNFTPPTTTSNRFRALLLMVNKNGLLQTVYGNEQTTFAGAVGTVPAVLKGTAALGVIIAQTDAAGNWKGVRPEDLLYFSSAGGAGGGSGDGGAAREPYKGYQLLSFDNFDVGPTDALSLVESSITTGTHSTDKELYRLLCDKAPTVSTTGTAYTLSAAPSFTMKIGDVIYHNLTQTFRRVASVTTTTTGTLDAAFANNLSAAACMVSQAVWTKDLVNLGSASEQTRPRDLFPAQTIDVARIYYEDTLVAGDNVLDIMSAANIIAFSTSSGLQSDTSYPNSDAFGGKLTRPTGPNAFPSVGMPLNANMQRLFHVFMCNPDNGSVTSGANLLGYETSFVVDGGVVLANVRDSAYCYTDGSAPAIGCSQPTVVSSKTRIQLNFSFATIVHPNKTTGELNVYLDGKKLPKYISGSTTDAWWAPVAGFSNLIELDADYSASNFSVEIERKTNESGDAQVNAIRLAALYDVIVGSAAQVATGAATHTTLQDAHDAAPVGGLILILRGSYAGNTTLTKQVSIIGQGRGSELTGTLTFDATSDYSSLQMVRLAGNVTINAGSVGTVLSPFWKASAATITDNGTDSLVLGVGE